MTYQPLQSEDATLKVAATSDRAAYEEWFLSDWVQEQARLGRFSDNSRDPRITIAWLAWQEARRQALEEAAAMAESDEFYGSAVQHDIASAIRREAEGK